MADNTAQSEGVSRDVQRLEENITPSIIVTLTGESEDNHGERRVSSVDTPSVNIFSLDQIRRRPSWIRLTSSGSSAPGSPAARVERTVSR